MEVRPIRSEEDYKAMLAIVSELIDRDPDPNSPEGERLEVLGTLIEVYEARHFPMSAPTPIAAIRFRMDQDGLSPKDLEPMIGKSNRVYEVLNGTRPLTIRMIRNLHRQLKIPAEVLIQA